MELNLDDGSCGQKQAMPFVSELHRMVKVVTVEPSLGLDKREEQSIMEDGAGDFTCAICLNEIDLPELAMVKGCEHVYCACCILTWATLKEPHVCPQCKNPFAHLLMYRSLDGTLSDYPKEESVCLLKRAHWFMENKKVADRVSDLELKSGSVIDEADWGYFEEYDDDEVEAYYFSAAAGRARVVLGNRRWGENGYVSSGRMQARPAHRPPASKEEKSRPSGRKSGGMAGPPQPCNLTCTPQSSSKKYQRQKDVDLPCSSGNTPTSCDKPGRRARRNARRTADDAVAGIV